MCVKERKRKKERERERGKKGKKKQGEIDRRSNEREHYHIMSR